MFGIKDKYLKLKPNVSYKLEVMIISCLMKSKINVTQQVIIPFKIP